MSEIEIFMELLDEKILDYILAEFFSDNNPKQHINVKKMKLQKLLRDPVSTKMKKRYRTKGNSCLQVLKRELVDKQLLDCDMHEFISSITSGEKSNLSNLELFFTAYVKYPDIIKGHFSDIIHNHKEKSFLFTGIDEFNISEDYLKSIELSKLQQDIKSLREEAEKIKLELDLAKEENNKLNIDIHELNNENKKFKKVIKKQEKEIVQINNENDTLKNTIKNKEDLIQSKNKEIKDLNNECKDLKDTCKNLKKDKDALNVKYEEIKNKEYLDVNNELYSTEYESCLIYTSPILATRSLFRDILFISYEEYTNNSERVLHKLNKLGITNLYIMTSNISTREIAILKRKIKKEGIGCKTLLSSSELNMVKELIKNKIIL